MTSSCKVVLITGASRGIGRAIAVKMGSLGYTVALNCRSSAKQVEEVASEIRACGSRAEVFVADVTDVTSVKDMFDAVRDRLGPVSVLVNNAGVVKDNLLMRMKDEEWEEVLKADLTSAFYCTREAIRDMAKARWGRIICMSSVVGLMGNAGQANYAAAKAGLIGFAKSVAREYGTRNVTVNVVAPGFIETDMTRALGDKYKEDFLRQVPLGRAGRPEDVANLVAFFGFRGGWLHHRSGDSCRRRNGNAVTFWKEVKLIMRVEEIESKLKQIVMDRLDVDEDQITPEASFVEDLGADSLDIVELIMGIEEEFDIEIPDEDAEKLTTVGGALEYIKSQTWRGRIKGKALAGFPARALTPLNRRSEQLEKSGDNRDWRR